MVDHWQLESVEVTSQTHFFVFYCSAELDNAQLPKREKNPDHGCPVCRRIGNEVVDAGGVGDTDFRCLGCYRREFGRNLLL